MADTFRARLRAATAAHGSLCPGIDPSSRVLRQWGLEDSARGATEFAIGCIEAFAGLVAAVKPNVAFFEQYGSAGIAGLESVLAAASGAGLLTLADAKRGDIGSTNEAYARAWLDPESPLAVDSLTVSPYLGAAALAPFIDLAEQHGRGVFIVMRSSNPEGRAVQLSRTVDGRTLEAALLDELAARPEVVGAVIGLMTGQAPLALPEASFYLAPGLFTQGAGLDDLGTQFGSMTSAPVLVNLSRSFAAAGPNKGALRSEAVRIQDEIAARLCPASR
jgi:orotidine-5'-phosphate decarboxylase